LVIVAVKDAAVAAAATAGSSQQPNIRIEGALGRGAPFFWPIPK